MFRKAAHAARQRFGQGAGGGGARALGARRERAAACSVAWLPSRRVRKALQRWLIPLQARLRRLLRRGQATTDRKAAGLCRQLRKWWAALWTFARAEGVEPTNNVAERALRPAGLWRRGSFGPYGEAGSPFAERLPPLAAPCRQQARGLLDFLVAAGEAALHGSAGPSLLPARRGGERLLAGVKAACTRRVPGWPGRSRPF